MSCPSMGRAPMNGTDLNHPGYKYSKYKQALEYIRTYGHAVFLSAAEHWTNAYGKYSEQDP